MFHLCLQHIHFVYAINWLEPEETKSWRRSIGRPPWQGHTTPYARTSSVWSAHNKVTE